MFKILKNILIPNETREYQILGGIAKGCKMRMNLRNRLQRWIGLDERELLRPLKRLIATSKSLVDVGANDGFYTISFLASGAECVVACEGSTAVSEELRTNAKANGHEPGHRFRLLNACIGDELGNLPLRDVLADVPHPVLVKLDVDGVEVSVLKSAEGHPLLNSVSWILEVHSPELEQACIEWFHSHNYSTRIIDNAWWRKIVPETRLIAHNRWVEALPRS